MRVLVAMSGGVDSTMAAALLVEAGHEVTGVHLKMADTPSGLPGRGCCTLDDARDARRVADALDIPFYVWDMHDAFTEQVVDDFVTEYAQGRTPNPCIRCNERVKYVAVQDRARSAGFDALATGHHVRLNQDETGRWHMFRPVDTGKDQTYVLYMATQDRLSATLFPCGDYPKATLRAMAKERRLLTASKPDSSDICFIPDRDTSGFLHRQLGSAPGPIVDTQGNEVGTHDGAFAYTIGQRRGLGLGGQAEPKFVTGIRGNVVQIGSRTDLQVAQLAASGATWVLGDPPIDVENLTARVRYHGDQYPVTIEVDGDTVTVYFPQARPLGVAPGQAVVFYDGDECLGGATIDHALA
ncbi:tRNA 2-thiouridine(34) synthase MnmA [Stomatohabitans albus]|uniref:tRNA 2-thiouridine(34) synthase MnmA n=1 Tax=Stomatohabitans albus TaxID=3110766 RepID=UPI00300CFF2A